MIHPAITNARIRVALFRQRRIPGSRCRLPRASGFHSLAPSSYLLEQTSSSSSSVTLSFDDPRFRQVRWKRRDGNKAFHRVRPPTKKQRKAYNRKLKAQRERESAHGRPGSKAGKRREWIQTLKDDFLNSIADDKEDPSLLEYGVEDALLDDLMGNTKELSSQPTPRPVYLGHRHEKYDAQLRNRMHNYNRLIEESASEGSGSDSGSALMTGHLPSDRSIALALRSYRDKRGTRQRPIGIVAALEYLLQDVGLSVAAFGELTYTTLLTCCRTPAEARRILAIMKREQHPVSKYSWSILVDVYAKVGDYEGAASAIEEMVAEGVPPTLPAYTSFLAACYKVCNDGRVAHSIRAKAGTLAFEKWQEMRIVGVDPDAMAYGAMLRVCAAQGHPERALNVLEEMQQMDVKPTTLCFSSALRAVARSHATAIRFERGFSKRNRRREWITKHHGKIARSIVIMAENAEVEQDDGFISALVLCAAAAGDVATAKAIYVASQIRNLDQFRTIGPESHLTRLAGKDEQLPSPGEGSTSSALTELQSRNKSRRYPSFEEREYGKDSRVLSAILHACAQAVHPNSIGTLWAGRENKGYLCENSLRLLVARRVPQYTDLSIPGQRRTDDLTWEGEYKDEDYRGNKRKPRKFTGVDVSENGADNLDELDDTFARMFIDEDGRRKEEFRKTSPEDIWRMKYGEDDEYLIDGNYDNHLLEDDEITALASEEPEPDTEDKEEEELFFDYDSMRWKTRPKNKDEVAKSIEKNGASKIKEQHPSVDSSVQKETSSEGRSVEPDVEELYFDDDAMQWKTRLKTETKTQAHTDYESKILQTDKDPGRNMPDSGEIDAAEFSEFFSELQEEIAKSGEDIENVNEEEARELFLLMKSEYNEVMDMELEDLDSIGVEDNDDPKSASLNIREAAGEAAIGKDPNAVSGEENSKESLQSEPQHSIRESTLHNTIDDSREDGKPDEDSNMKNNKLNVLLEEATQTIDDSREDGKLDGDLNMDNNKLNMLLAEAAQTVATITPPLPPPVEPSEEKSAPVVSSNAPAIRENFSETVEVVNTNGPVEALEEADEELENLRQLLPAFSDKRLRRILQTFRKSLGDPSLLDLLPIVRENMPDYLTATWLKKMSLLTARYVMLKASEDGLVDQHVLNSVLELETLSGSLDRAVDFYETAFEEHNLFPNEYSNRLVLQMFLTNNRLARALAFRERLKEGGQLLDIPSYGSLVDYCARHGQIGSSMLLLKECISVHGSPPGEASLSALRVLCRKAGLENDELTAMIGEDPIKWLKHGEAHLKREYSKRGRRDTLFARNQLVRL